MKQAADTVLRSVTVTEAFRNSISGGDGDNFTVKDQSDPLGGPKSFNPGGLDIPYVEGGLNRYEKLYLRSAEYGDVNTARRLIDNAKHYNINVNCMDDMGRGAIRIAIEAEQIELLQMLLTYEVIDLKDCLLHAISEENVQAVELILQAQSERQQRKNLKVCVWILIGLNDASINFFLLDSPVHHKRLDFIDNPFFTCIRLAHMHSKRLKVNHCQLSQFFSTKCAKEPLQKLEIIRPPSRMIDVLQLTPPLRAFSVACRMNTNLG